MSGRTTGGALTKAGRSHAERLADGIARGESVAAIHSSPQQRAGETAQAIADRLGLAVRVIAALDEVDFGRWTGRRFSDLEDDPDWRRWNTARATASPPDGEPMAVAVARAVDHITAVSSTTPQGAILCVSHCDIIRGVVAHYLGLGLDHLLRFDVDPGSISTLVIGDWGGRLLALNGGRQ